MHSTTRRVVQAGLAAAFVLASATSAVAKPADVEVEFSSGCSSVEVWSSKDLSNVVIVTFDGEVFRFEDLDGMHGEFAPDDGRIERVYVKSGNNHSGEGPGYGERFDC